ncbi:DCC1-like thiol-disulfide oxidoreductase family protein [Belliella sp. R4-6]|uniref:DCC1-like thiol-disulfide oxidoreductase family protein n=1 Tax=Belliella alkalica TaxID=1730871 RepID=A0ABS9VI26_9BACT|nr:DCC1-like thiol-disulfide oxidoreductase family protein [Belliella alkalica]MCH7415680.1 DCC1-like thiol-disulfide oxidoreductase family protein [Belliella alkalica]
MRIQDKYSIVLFDGVCNLCNNAVDFIIRKDKNDKFKVGALQDEAVKKILVDYKVKKDYLDSLVLIERNEIYYKSTAALKIAKKLGGIWKIFYAGIILPASWRDSIYDWIAENRYKWYGKKETCRLPTPEEKAKFL